MKKRELLRHSIIGIVLFLGVCWSLSSAAKEAAEAGYPDADLLASPEWLMRHADDEGLVIVDVRADKYFDGELIAGAIRMPWKLFRHNDTAGQVASVFAGVENAQKVLGEHGIVASDAIVLYDSVKRDGGATSSYVFWALDMLGHEKKKVLNGGIDAWKAAGGDVSKEAALLEKQLYQVDPDAINTRLWGTAKFIYERLGDPHYQIIDVRSGAEYLGEKGNKDLNDKPLKLGHIPGAVNIEYKKAWIDNKTKRIKPYSELQEVYRGIDPSKGTIVYCHSGRRGSFSYFILRLMGFSDVIEYEASWNEWGSYREYLPTELKENRITGNSIPSGSADAARTARTGNDSARGVSQKPQKSSVGYVSCGG